MTVTRVFYGWNLVIKRVIHALYRACATSHQKIHLVILMQTAFLIIYFQIYINIKTRVSCMFVEILIADVEI